VKGNEADLVIEDGDYNVLKSKHITSPIARKAIGDSSLSIT
jgi:hypothetical protein